MDKKKTIIIGLAFLVLAGLYIQSTVWFRLKLASIYKSRGNKEKTIEIYGNILRKDQIQSGNSMFSPDELSRANKYKLAKTLADYNYTRNNRLKALQCYKIVREIVPSDPGNYINIYFLNKDLDGFIDAVLKYKEYSLLSKIPEECLDIPLWNYKIGVAMIREREWDQAERFFLNLVQRYPYLSSYHLYLGFVFKELGLADKAKKEYKIAKYLNDNINDTDFLFGRDNIDTEFDFVGIYKLDNSVSKGILDCSGLNNYAEIINPEFVAGIDGKGLLLDGKGSRVIFSNNTKMFLDGKDFTIAMWVNPDKQKKNRFVYSKGSIGIFLREEGDVWNFGLRDEQGSKSIDINYKTERGWYFVVQSIKQNKYHKVFLFDRSNLIERLEREDILTTTGSDDYTFVLGEKGSSLLNNATFKGIIDEVMIFNRALTDNEIYKLHSYSSKQ